MTENCGIYRIVINKPDGSSRYYIGQSCSLSGRKAQHFRSLRLGNHKNRRLQRAYDAHGAENVSFEIVMICARDPGMLSLYERLVIQRYIDEFGRDAVYNICLDCVGSRLGVRTAEKTKAKMSAAALGKKRSPETCARISAAKKGQSPPPEHMERLRQLASGRPMPEHVKATLLAKLTGVKKSPEELARRAATRKANAEARGYY